MHCHSHYVQLQPYAQDLEVTKVKKGKWKLLYSSKNFAASVFFQVKTLGRKILVSHLLRAFCCSFAFEMQSTGC